MAEIPPPPPLTLQSIYLRSSLTSMAEDFHPNLPGQNLAPLFRTENRGRVSCNTTTMRDDDGAEQKILWCAFVTKFEFVYVRPKGDSSPQAEDEIEKGQLARIVAEIVATYSVDADGFPAEGALHHWGSHYVLLHTWPYWREFCHNALLRMGLPVTMIPLIQIKPQLPEPPETSS